MDKKEIRVLLLSKDDVEKAISEMVRVAKTQVVIAWFRPPWRGETQVQERTHVISVLYNDKFIKNAIMKNKRVISFSISKIGRKRQIYLISLMS